ncbi:MAG: hypothetical protein AAF639_46995, partial [Chloroflexota bacterium]
FAGPVNQNRPMSADDAKAEERIDAVVEALNAGIHDERIMTSRVYVAFIELLNRRFADQPRMQFLLEEYQDDPEGVESLFRKKLQLAEIESDRELVKVARQVIQL